MRYGIKRFADDYGNIALIEAFGMLPYRGAPTKVQTYRVCCHNEDLVLYYCNCYETYEEAYKHMMILSCGSWKEDQEFSDKEFKNYTHPLVN